MDPMGSFKVLPPEIVNIIIGNLKGASIIAFALTCRAHYSYFPRRLPPLSRLNSSQKMQFLQQLEAIYPSHFFCHGCNKLHEFKHRQRRYKHWFGADLPQFRCQRLGWIKLPFDYSSGLNSNFARVLMNHHFYGCGHGYPLEWLELNHKDSRAGDIQLSFSRVGRVLDDELYLLSKCTFWHPSGDIQPMRSYFAGPEHKSFLFICRHIQVVPISPGSMYGAAKSIQRMANQSFPGFGSSQTARSCPTCPTDYTVTVVKHDMEDSWRVHLEVYQSLGSCRSTYDWKWKSHANRDWSWWTMSPMDGDIRKTQYAAGAARQRWLQEEGGGDVGARSEFVDDALSSDNQEEGG